MPKPTLSLRLNEFTEKKLRRRFFNPLKSSILLRNSLPPWLKHENKQHRFWNPSRQRKL